MRLLDSVAQSTAPLLVRQKDGELWHLTAPAEFAARVAGCPLRYVLDDELVRTCMELAYSEGDELSGCLDLLHFPAEQLWVEWRDVAQRAALASVLPECVPERPRNAERSGVLITAAPGGRAASLRSFWLTASEPHETQVSAVETLLDFDCGYRTAGQGLLEDSGAEVYDPKNACLNELLRCARFRVDGAWRRYYRAVLTDPTAARAIPLLVAGVAFDVPMLLALFLLMAVRADLLQRAVNPARLNHKRARLGKRPLLEHIEVSAPLLAHAACHGADTLGGTLRSSPRLHHVRGHIVRRRNTVYWRGPHWRGHLRLGQVRTRTVELRLHG